jgi:hypothetical protein
MDNDFVHKRQADDAADDVSVFNTLFCSLFNTTSIPLQCARYVVYTLCAMLKAHTSTFAAAAVSVIVAV